MSRRSRRVTVALGMATAAFVSMPQAALAVGGGGGGRIPGGRPRVESIPANSALREAPGLEMAPGLRTGCEMAPDTFGLQLVERNVENGDG